MTSELRYCSDDSKEGANPELAAALRRTYRNPITERMRRTERASLSDGASVIARYRKAVVMGREMASADSWVPRTTFPNTEPNRVYSNSRKRMRSPAVAVRITLDRRPRRLKTNAV